MPEPVDLSLGDVFIANRTRLRRIARSLAPTSELADDVMQDAYLRLIDVSNARKVANPFSYCCQVVRNLSLDYCRRHKLEAAYRADGVDVEMLEFLAVGSPDRSVRDMEALRAIDRALASVPPRTRLVFELYRLDGLTQREISKRIGCALGLVNAMIAEAARAIEPCREQLED
jgi:RNA polymerase sigma-70 factor (ECF subfamily)